MFLLKKLVEHYTFTLEMFNAFYWLLNLSKVAYQFDPVFYFKC